MTSVLPLGILSLVLSFLVGVMGGFPTGAETVASPEATIAQTDGSSKEAAEEFGNLFLSRYSAIVDGLLAHQDNPDYARAEAERVKLLEYGESLIPQFNDLAQELNQKLTEITPELSEQ